MSDDLVDGPESGEKRAKKGSDADLLSVARKRLQTAMSALSDSRESQLDDQKFAEASPDTPEWQWPTYALNTRANADGISARPTLVINKMPQHVHQVTNDQRQNRPSGKVIPANTEADVEVAEILNGMVRHIEYISDAPIAYDTACDSQVKQGEGYFRIVTDYCDENTFDQDILIQRVRNPFSIYPDPMIQSPVGRDMKWCWILEDVTKDEYETQYPDAAPVSVINDAGTGDQSIADWIGEETIRIGEYFWIECTYEKLNLYPDGQMFFDNSPEAKMYKEAGIKPVRSRESERRQVKWIKTNGYEILEERDWPGKYIPVIRVPGNEFEIEGKLYLSGIVRNAKDAQRMYNYHASNEVEMLALAPKAPFVGAAGQFEGFEDKWKTANTTPWPYLEYNQVVDEATGLQAPPPQRVQPPMLQQGIIAAKQAAADDIKTTTGQYNASLGQTSNERSGKAILARQHEGDVSTYHYGNNLALAIQFGTLQIVDLIPKIYDTARVARIMGENNESKMVKLNPDQPEPVRQVQNPMTGAIEKIYNPSVGKYDVVVVTGPGYSTKRREAAESMAEMLQTNPELWAVAGDIFAKNLDWPGSRELAKRLAKAVDPKLLADEDNPALMKLQEQNQQLMAQLQQAMQMVEKAQQSIEAREIAVKEAQVQIQAYDAETKRIAVMKPADPVQGQQVEQMVQPPPLDPNKQMMEQSKHALQDKQHAHEAEMARMNAAHSAQAAEQQAALAPPPMEGQ